MQLLPAELCEQRSGAAARRCPPAGASRARSPGRAAHGRAAVRHCHTAEVSFLLLRQPGLRRAPARYRVRGGRATSGSPRLPCPLQPKCPLRSGTTVPRHPLHGPRASPACPPQSLPPAGAAPPQPRGTCCSSAGPPSPARRQRGLRAAAGQGQGQCRRCRPAAPAAPLGAPLLPSPGRGGATRPDPAATPGARGAGCPQPRGTGPALPSARGHRHALSPGAPALPSAPGHRPCAPASSSAPKRGRDSSGCAVEASPCPARAPCPQPPLRRGVPLPGRPVPPLGADVLPV